MTTGDTSAEGVTPTLPQREREQLRLFVQAVCDMVDSRFIQHSNKQDHSIEVKRLDNGDWNITAPDYDWEDFRSFLTNFRQVAFSDKEPIYLPRIRNIASQYGS